MVLFAKEMRLPYYRHFQEDDMTHRYDRQIILPGMGMQGQEKLQAAKVLVIGAGGLGCPALLQCTLMGIGTIGIADFDQVSLHNIHRQSLYDETSVGYYKVDIAQKVLEQKNSAIRFQIYSQRVEAANIFPLIEPYDVIVDATDNFVTRYLINDACVAAGKVLVYGAIFQYEGQVAVFNHLTSGRRTTHYRHLFPDPSVNVGISCSDSGVLGALTHIIGDLMASEVFKLITGIGTVTSNALLHYDMLQQRLSTFTISPSTSNINIDKTFVTSYDYALFCRGKNILSADEIKQKLTEKSVLLIDLRKDYEQPPLRLTHHRCDYNTLWENIDWMNDSKTIIFVCQTGSRSRKARQEGAEKFPHFHWYAFEAGAKALNEIYD